MVSEQPGVCMKPNFGDYWQDAIAEFQAVSKAFASLAKKPDDEAIVLKTLKVVNKGVEVSLWVDKVYLNHDLLKIHREISGLIRNFDKVQAQDALRRYKDGLQEILNNVGPTHFDHLGFKVNNPERLSWSMMDVALNGIAFLVNMFKKRGVDQALLKSVKDVTIVPYSDKFSASMDSRTGSLFLNIRGILKAGRFTDVFVNETLVHEVAHFIHHNLISREAYNAWEEPWKGLKSKADPKFLYLNKMEQEARKEKIDQLDVVTEYGKVDQYEDFAETFMLFVIAPEKLTPNAKLRMQRVLSLSSLYGKPLMKASSTTDEPSGVVMSYVKTALMFPLGSEAQLEILKLAATLPTPKRMAIGPAFRKQVNRYMYDIISEAFDGDPELEKRKQSFYVRMINFTQNERDWANSNQVDMVSWLTGKSKPPGIWYGTFPELVQEEVKQYGSQSGIVSLRQTALSSMKKLTQEQNNILAAIMGMGTHGGYRMQQEIEGAQSEWLARLLNTIEWAAKIPPSPDK